MRYDDAVRVVEGLSNLIDLKIEEALKKADPDYDPEYELPNTDKIIEDVKKLIIDDLYLE